MQLSKKHAASAAIVLCIAVTTYVYWARHHIKTDNAYLKANMILVTSKVTGLIEKIHAKDNEWVKSGSPLFTIDQSDYEDKVRQAEADVEAQTAKHTNLVEQEDLQRSVINEVAAIVEARKATLAEAQKNLKRLQSLKKTGSTSAFTLDEAVSKHKNALSALVQANAQLQGAKDKLDVLHADQAAAIAGIKKAKATLALHKRMLEDTVIKAPFDGIFTNRGVYVGQLVHPALNLAHLVEQKHMWVEANYKENQMDGIKTGLRANIKIDAYPKIDFSGIVESISPASGAEFSILPPENATGNFTKIVRRIPVKITIDEPKDKLALLKSGLSAVVTVLVP